MAVLTEHRGAPRTRWRGRRLLFAVVIVALPVAATALAVRSRSRPSTAAGSVERRAIFRTTLQAEPGTRDPLHIESVRVWSTRSLAGTWCRLAIGADVDVVAVERTPDLVFEVASAARECRGWVSARHTSDGQTATR